MSEKQLNLLDFDDDFAIYTLLNETFLPNEDFEVEYKSGKNGFPKELWKTYSAFANTNTGVIIIGVKENKENLLVEGLNNQQIEKYKKQFWNECNNPNKVSRNLISNEDLKVVEFKNKKLMAIKVPFANRTERPVYLTQNPLRNTYKRNHEGDYRCTDDEVKRMLADSSAELKRDSLILEHFTVDDFDPSTVKKFKQLFTSSKPDHPWHALEDIDLFKKIGAYRIDRKTKNEGITLAGLLMFGKEDSIKEQEALPDYFPDFREQLSNDPDVRWTDRICPDGTWECNLLQFYLRVWPKLSSTLPKPFKLNNDERVDETPTHIALREAFVNALVHTDYSQGGSIIVELDMEKFVFSNPGSLLVSIHQYYAGGISECRNPALQQMFMLIGRAEKAGSGVDKIMSGWQQSHWRKPFLEIEHQPSRVLLTLPMFSVIPESTLNELNVIFDDLSYLSPDELTALSFCQIEGSISNQRLQYVLNLHSSDITSLLKKLCADGYLQSDNNGRWTTYKLKQKVATSDKKVATSSRKVDTSDEKVDTSKESVKNEGSRDGKVATSDKKVATSSRKVATSNKKVDTYGVNITEIKGKNIKRDELELIILKICKEKYVKKEELAAILGKSENYIRNKILPDLLKSKKIIKRYPYTHNHPQQGYKTSEKYAKKLKK